MNREIMCMTISKSKQETSFVGKVAIVTVVIVGIGCFIAGYITGTTNA